MLTLYDNSLLNNYNRLLNNDNRFMKVILKSNGPVRWGCGIHRPHLCRRVRPFPTIECSGYDIKHSDGEASVILELWGMQSTPLLSSLRPGVVVPDKVLSMGQIELNCVFMLN